MVTAVAFAYHDVGARCLRVLRAHGVDVPLVVTHPDDPQETRWFARNLADQQESDLRAPSRIDLHDIAKAPGTSSAMFTFWPYLLIASLLLFFLEWFISPRMRRLKVRRRAVQPA